MNDHRIEEEVPEGASMDERAARLVLVFTGEVPREGEVLLVRPRGFYGQERALVVTRVTWLIVEGLPSRARVYVAPKEKA